MASIIRQEIHIQSEPATVFATLTQLERLPDWATTAETTEDIPPQPLRAGQTFTMKIRVLGKLLDAEWTVTDIGDTWVEYRAEGPLGSWLRMRQSVAGADGGSRVSLDAEYELPAGVLGDIVDELYVQGHNEQEAQQSLRNLKQLVETGSTAA